jgi:DNA ligase-1
MRLGELVAVSEAVAATRSRNEKVARLAACLRALAEDEIAFGVAALAGRLPERHGVGFAAIGEASAAPAAAEATLALAEVARALAELAALAGRGSAGERRRRLGALFARATPAEQRFLAGLLAGGLRQGAAEGLVLEALARASGAPPEAVRRALAVSGALAALARAALSGGAPALAGFRLALFRPLPPMLAQPADDPAGALADFGSAAFEWKLDGARVQLHKDGEQVRIYSRRLNDVSEALPEIVEAGRALPARSAVLDGEAIALRPDGRPEPFQTTMRRFGRRLDVARLRRELPLATFFFDCLHLEGDDLLALPTRERFAALAGAVPEALRVPRIVSADAEEAERFYDAALAAGHEGVMAKALDAPYEAGGRGGAWRKLKTAQTLDLVVLAAEWGSGRREGWLSNLHLGARDPEKGAFAMLGKTFKGLSDALLEWQTRELLAREIARDAQTVHVRPELVVEIALSGVQTSPHYPAGLALRFARVRRYRPDKRPEDADTLDAVRALHAAGGGAAA